MLNLLSLAHIDRQWIGLGFLATGFIFLVIYFCLIIYKGKVQSNVNINISAETSLGDSLALESLVINIKPKFGSYKIVLQGASNLTQSSDAVDFQSSTQSFQKSNKVPLEGSDIEPFLEGLSKSPSDQNHFSSSLPATTNQPRSAQEFDPSENCQSTFTIQKEPQSNRDSSEPTNVVIISDDYKPELGNIQGSVLPPGSRDLSILNPPGQQKLGQGEKSKNQAEPTFTPTAKQVATESKEPSTKMSKSGQNVSGLESFSSSSLSQDSFTTSGEGLSPKLNKRSISIKSLNVGDDNIETQPRSAPWYERFENGLVEKLKGAVSQSDKKKSRGNVVRLGNQTSIPKSGIKKSGSHSQFDREWVHSKSGITVRSRRPQTKLTQGTETSKHPNPLPSDQNEDLAQSYVTAASSSNDNDSTGNKVEIQKPTTDDTWLTASEQIEDSKLTRSYSENLSTSNVLRKEELSDSKTETTGKELSADSLDEEETNGDNEKESSDKTSKGKDGSGKDTRKTSSNVEEKSRASNHELNPHDDTPNNPLGVFMNHLIRNHHVTWTTRSLDGEEPFRCELGEISKDGSIFWSVVERKEDQSKIELIENN